MIKISNVYKSFGSVQILQNINIDIKDHEFVCLTGRSGSGKSTLLYIISTLDNPTRGDVEIDQLSIQQTSIAALHEFRNLHMGFVFQFHYLLPELSAIENVLIPARKTHQHKKTALIGYAHELLKQFNIDEKSNHYPSQLSGGEQQRVAIARALIMKPRYIFCDEPTGNLDSYNGNIVMSILKELNQTLGTTIIFVTHDSEFAKKADRQIILVDGKIEG